MMLPVDLQIILEETSGVRIRFEYYVNTIGRNPNNRIALTPQCISKTHATILRMDGKWFLIDEGSRFGTFLNDIQLNEGESREFKIGDSIKLAEITFTVISYQEFLDRPTKTAVDASPPSNQ